MTLLSLLIWNSELLTILMILLIEYDLIDILSFFFLLFFFQGDNYNFFFGARGYEIKGHTNIQLIYNNIHYVFFLHYFFFPTLCSYLLCDI